MAGQEMRAVCDLKAHPANAKIYGEGDPADDAFTANVKEVGVGQPLVVLGDGTILSGHRRWRAAFRAGLEEVPVVVAEPADAAEAVYLLVKYNEQREKTNEQKANEARALLKVEKERAKARQKEHAGTAPGKPKTVPEHVPEVNDAPGEARDKVGEALGVSGKTAERMADVAEGIGRLEEAGEGGKAEEVRAALNGEGVAAAHRLLAEAAKRAEENGTLPPPEPPPEDGLGIPLSAALVGPFEALDDFDEIRSAFRKLQKDVSALACRPGGEELRSRCGLNERDGKQTFRLDSLRDAAHAVDACRPYTRCPHCANEANAAGLGPDFIDPACKACRGTGWASKAAFAASPPEYRELVAGLAPAKGGKP
jgi:ParB-like chromosome segregation protein Spo0J